MEEMTEVSNDHVGNNRIGLIVNAISIREYYVAGLPTNAKNART